LERNDYSTTDFWRQDLTFGYTRYIVNVMSLLGERLRHAREARGISPLQVEIETRIRANVIQALEEGDFESLPPEPFLRGLIRSYSNYLGVDSQEMLDLYVADFTPVVPLSTPNRLPPPIKQVNASSPPQSIPEPVQMRAPKAPPTASFPQPTFAQTVPTGSVKPAMPPPPSPPETLAPPERLERAPLPEEKDTSPRFLAHITRRGIPLPVVVLIALAVILSCLAGTLMLVTQVVPAVVSSAQFGTQTPTRAPATPEATALPGALPTSIPTLAVTAEPFATFPGNPTVTLAAATRRTPAVTTGLNLDVEVSQTIKIDVGVDGVMVFSGTLDPGTTRSWTAKDAMYVRVENPKGATLLFNDDVKWFGARNYAERTVLERMWTVNDKGTPISVPPVAPAGTPAAAPAAIPSPTLTPFS
jgi:hypothetical protein